MDYLVFCIAVVSASTMLLLLYAYCIVGECLIDEVCNDILINIEIKIIFKKTRTRLNKNCVLSRAPKYTKLTIYAIGTNLLSTFASASPYLSAQLVSLCTCQPGRLTYFAFMDSPTYVIFIPKTRQRNTQN